VAALEQDQPMRRAAYLNVALQVDEFINNLQKLKDVEEGFTLVIEDISGNIFV